MGGWWEPTHTHPSENTPLNLFSSPPRLLLLLPRGMCQVRAGLRLQRAPLRQVQLLQVGAGGQPPPRRADPGGSRRKLTLFSVFFLYVRSDTFSVWHAWRALSYLNKAMCI